MPIQSAEVEERLRVFRALHIEELPRRVAQVLLLQAVGQSDEEVAFTLDVAISTIQKHAYP